MVTSSTYVFSTYSVYIQYIFSTYSVYIQYIFSTYSVHIQYIFSIYSVYIQYIFSTYSVHIQYIFSIYSVYIRYIFQYIFITNMHVVVIALHCRYIDCISTAFSAIFCDIISIYYTLGFSHWTRIFTLTNGA